MAFDVHVQETSNLEPVTTDTTRTIAERETKAVTLTAESLCDAWIGYQNELVPDIFPHSNPTFEAFFRAPRQQRRRRFRDILRTF